MAKRFIALFAWSLGLAAGLSLAEEFPLELAKQGERIYNMRCVRCHGARLVNAGGFTFDLRRLKPDERERFFRSVANGKGAMPAWGDLLNAQQLEALWAYVITEGRNQ